jgi:2',3'-cyclic-nucleotide 2'-phosphodiesterase
MRLLFIGDLIGKSGRQALKALLPKLMDKYKIDLVIANGENAAAGFGITEPTAQEIFAAGVDIITTGNHVWDKKEAVSYLSKEPRVIRPINYPSEVPGNGIIIIGPIKKHLVAIINVAGRVFMNSLDCPFRTAKTEIDKIKEKTNIIIVDFHGEATSEKVAFGHYLDGQVSAVIGTHTHVQTADEKILPKGTAYISDAGMTGPADSVIGIAKEQIIDKFLTGMPRKFDVAEGKAILCAVVVDIDEENGKATAIQRLQLTHDGVK